MSTAGDVTYRSIPITQLKCSAEKFAFGIDVAQLQSVITVSALESGQIRMSRVLYVVKHHFKQQSELRGICAEVHYL